VLPKTEAARLEPLARSIGTRVRALKERQAQTASLLDQSINLASDTIEFLQRLLVRSDAPAYGRRSPTVRPPSLLVDSRA
jgi:hypothetical protein